MFHSAIKLFLLQLFMLLALFIWAHKTLLAQTNFDSLQLSYTSKIKIISIETVFEPTDIIFQNSIQNNTLKQVVKARDHDQNIFQIYEKNKWLWIPTTLIASFGTDIYLRNAAQKQRYQSLDWWLERTNRLGELDLIAKGMSIGLITGFFIESPRLKQSSLNVVRSYLLSRIITDITKRSFGRARPFLNQGNSYVASIYPFSYHIFYLQF
jgi:hypothetical protein